MDFVVRSARPDTQERRRCLITASRVQAADPRAGDRIVLWVIDDELSGHLVGIAAVVAVSDSDPVVLALAVSDDLPLRPLTEDMLAPHGAGSTSASGGLAEKLRRPTPETIVALERAEAACLEASFHPATLASAGSYPAPSVFLRDEGSYRATLYRALLGAPETFIPVSQLPTKVGRGPTPYMRRARISSKLEARGYPLEVLIKGPKARPEAVGLFTVGKTAEGVRPSLSPSALARDTATIHRSAPPSDGQEEPDRHG
jgi:hypothetical protein